jgi:ABC-2 type transport system permease protein
MRKRIVALMLKEFLALLKDKKSRLVIIVPPVLQLLVFGYAATYDLKHIPYALYNEDQGLLSRELIAEFSGSPTFLEQFVVTHDEQIAPLINDKRVLLVLHIGPRFSRDLLNGRQPSVQIIVDGRNSNTAMLALTYINSIINQLNEQWSQRFGRPGSPARLVIRAWFNPNLESQWFMVPGIVGLLTLVVTMLVTALSVAREREQGTFDQLLVTPFLPFEILMGKALPGFFIGISEATLVIVVAVLWFKVPLLGDLWTLYAGVVLFVISAIGVGLMISSLSVTLQQGLLGAFLFLVPSIILSGFTTPIANMPPLVQHITFLNPMRYFMVVLRGVFLEGTPFLLLIDQFWPMALIGIATLAIASSLFRHRMY